MMNIAVFCGSGSGCDNSYYKLAYDIGQLLAVTGAKILHGGVNMGLMKALNNGVKDGKGYSIGILPEIFQDYSFGFHEVDEIILTKSIHERKEVLFSLADSFLLLPGGYGSLDEFFEVLTLIQVNQIKKTVIVFNFESYYDSLYVLISKLEEEKFITHHEKILCNWVNNISQLTKYLLK